MKIVIEQEISEEAIDNVLCCALDPGCGGAYYWCSARRDPKNPARHVEYLHEVPMAGGTILITDVEDDNKVYKLNLAAIKRGLKAMAKDEAVGMGALANIIKDETDADDGDALIQFSVLGGSIYG